MGRTYSGITGPLSDWEVLWGQPWAQACNCGGSGSVALQQKELVGWGAGVSWKDSPLTIPQEAASEGSSNTWRPPPSPVPPWALIT